MKKNNKPYPLSMHEFYRQVCDLEASNMKRCRTCKHRKRFELNDHSNKIVQCCVRRPSQRSNSGYRTIRVSDLACIYYEEQ